MSEPLRDPSKSAANPAAPASASAPPPRSPQQNRQRSVAWIVTIVFGVVILIPSMAGFVMKFLELIHLTQGDADGGFAITPVVNYLFASLGFFFLLLWAAVNGMFADLELPKHTMLENEAALDELCGKGTS